ncbi:hypothetical protein V8C37DRAFT_371933, partial [Trichoderma ceciliae]
MWPFGFLLQSSLGYLCALISILALLPGKAWQYGVCTLLLSSRLFVLRAWLAGFRCQGTLQNVYRVNKKAT